MADRDEDDADDEVWDEVWDEVPFVADAAAGWRARIAMGIAVAAAAALALAELTWLVPLALPLLVRGALVEATAVVAGFCAAAAVPPWAIWAWISHSDAWRGFARFVLLFAAAAVVASGTLAYRRLAEDMAHQVAMRRAEDMAVALADSDAAMAMVARHRGGTVKLHGSEAGDAGALEDAIRRMVDAVGAAERTEIAQVDAAGNAPLLKAGALALPGGVAAARARIARYRTIDADYDAAIGRALADYRAVLARNASGTAARTRALAAFDRHARDEQAYRRPRAAARAAYFDAHDAALRVLEHPHAPWQAKGDAIQFHDPRDRAAFDADQAAIDRAARALKPFVAKK